MHSKYAQRQKSKYDKMIIVVESRWLLYRGAHCTIMKLFCIFEKFNNKQLGKKYIISLLVPNHLLLLLSLYLRMVPQSATQRTPENCLSSTSVLGPLSSSPPHGCTMTSSVQWSKTPDQIFTKESILLDLEVRQPPIG